MRFRTQAALAAVVMAAGCQPAPKTASTSPLFEAPTDAATPPRLLALVQTPGPLEVLAPVPPLAAVGAATATTLPATATTLPINPGLYMVVGGVMAQVDETPIYTSKVMGLVDRELQAQARRLSPEMFRREAVSVIMRQLTELIYDEMEFKQDLRSLSEEDKKRAETIAVMERKQKVTAAAGSVEVARQLGSDALGTFDDRMQDEYRKIVVELHARRYVDPLVNVTPDQMREYYARNKATQFSNTDRARFRVIQINSAYLAGDNPVLTAIDKIKAIHDKAAAPGADFAALATAQTCDDYLRPRGGAIYDPGKWVERGSYSNTQVENAVWALSPGQVTDIIPAGTSFFVAKLEEKQPGRVLGFDDPAVQDQIRASLFQQQVAELSRKSRLESAAEAHVVEPTADQIDMAVDIAMQKYAQWNLTP